MGHVAGKRYMKVNTEANMDTDEAGQPIGRHSAMVYTALEGKHRDLN